MKIEAYLLWSQSHSLLLHSESAASAEVVHVAVVVQLIGPVLRLCYTCITLAVRQREVVC